MIITLNALEIGIAALVATIRRSTNVVTGVQGRLHVDDRDSFDMDFIGAKAEMAFAKAFDRCPDFSFVPRSGGYDFKIGDITIDVKATTSAIGQLIARPIKKGKASHYVLAIVRGETVRLAGWATERELFDESNVCALYKDGPPTHAIPQNKLHQLDDIQK